jgi:hypothetical protein
MSTVLAARRVQVLFTFCHMHTFIYTLSHSLSFTLTHAHSHSLTHTQGLSGEAFTIVKASEVKGFREMRRQVNDSVVPVLGLDAEDLAVYVDHYQVALGKLQDTVMEERNKGHRRDPGGKLQDAGTDKGHGRDPGHGAVIGKGHLTDPGQHQGKHLRGDAVEEDEGEGGGEGEGDGEISGEDEEQREAVRVQAARTVRLAGVKGLIRTMLENRIQKH